MTIDDDYGQFERSKPDSPLRRLAAELIQSAKADGDVAWIEDRNLDYVFAFDVCCAVLELDADYLRKGLLRQIESERLCRDYIKLEIDIPDDICGEFTHPYKNQVHCQECRNRYRRAYNVRRRQVRASRKEQQGAKRNIYHGQRRAANGSEM